MFIGTSGLHGICGLGITARDIGGEIGFEVPQRLFHIPRASQNALWI